jgi:hypothetical protein
MQDHHLAHSRQYISIKYDLLGPKSNCSVAAAVAAAGARTLIAGPSGPFKHQKE